jgi:hypothetical protein
VFEEDLDPLVVHYLRAMDLGFQDQTLGVYEQMTLSAAFRLLAAVVTALITSHTSALDRLAVHYASAWLRIPFLAHSHMTAQSSVYPLPRALNPPGSEVMVDGLSGRKVVRQQAPGTSTTHEVEDGLESLPQGVYPGPQEL